MSEAQHYDDATLRRAFWGLDPERHPEDIAFLSPVEGPAWEERALLQIITAAILIPGSGPVTGYLMDALEWYVAARAKRYREPSPEEAEEDDDRVLGDYLRGV